MGLDKENDSLKTKARRLVATKPRDSVGIRTRIACALTIRTSVRISSQSLSSGNPLAKSVRFNVLTAKASAHFRTSTCRAWSSSAIHSLGIYS